MTFYEENIVNTYGDSGRLWLSKLSHLIHEMSQQWNLRDLQPVDDLTYNYVLMGFQKQTPIVLKLILDSIRLKKEAHALTIFASHAGVSLYAQADHALLIERALPGQTLESYGYRPEKALSILCDVMKKLHQVSTPDKSLFPHIKDLITILDQNWDMPSHYLKKAITLRDQLLQTSDTPVLLHGDLSYRNVLLKGQEWHVIDPQGIMGYPLNEIGPFVLNPLPDTQYIANYFGFNIQEVRQWYFIHLILNICWSIRDNENPNYFLDLAEQFYENV